MILGGRYVQRSIVGLAIVGLLGGCAAGATVAPPAATPAAAASTPSPATAATPAGASVALAAPTATAARPPARTAKPIPTIGVPADDGARIIAVDTTPDPRARDLTIESPAVAAPMQVRLLLPRRFEDEPTARWPVVYLLHGSAGTYDDWWLESDVSELTAPTDLLVVLPYGGNPGWYSDWWNGGKGGPPKWETFHLVELRQLLERNWHAGDKRAIAGISMGGYGAIEYAARQPGMFAAAASFSGVLDPLSGASFLEMDPGLWGDPVAQADVWKAHDPTDNVAALKGTALYVAYGNGQPGPLDNGSPAAYDPDGAVEREVASESEAFIHQAATLKIPVTVDAYGNGTHSWAYWQRDLHRALPFILKALGE